MIHQVVVITSAESGLGASLAKKYSNQGAHVVLLGRNRERLLKVTETLRSKVLTLSAKKLDR